MAELALVAVGASAGGLAALNAVLAGLPSDFRLPIVVIQHMRGGASVVFEHVFRPPAGWRVQEAEEKTRPQPRHLYVAPPGYHLLIERDLSFALSVDEPVNWSRPSIDVLLESAADALGPALVAVVLTGANQDGAHGLARVHALGGVAVVQDPATAEIATMPEAALAAVPNAYVWPLADLGARLAAFVRNADEEALHA
jgi:two-component system chemotaxis response regulator CheB